MAPHGTLRVIDFDHGVDPDWQANVLRHFCSWRLHHPDPQLTFDHWIDEAAQGDEAYIVWALVTWRKLEDMAAFQLEALAYRTNLWQAHRGFGSNQQPPP